MVMGSKQVGKVATVLTGEKAPGKRGIIPTAVLGTGVDVSLRALDSTILGSRMQAIGANIPGTGIRFSIIDGLNFLIFFQGKTRFKSAITAVGGAKIITGAVNIVGLVPGIPSLSGGTVTGVAAAGGSSAVAAGAQGAPL